MARLITKNSQTPGAVPSSAALNTGELAVNTADAKLYTEHSDGSVKEITPTTVADNGITTAKIADSNVTTAKIADSAVTNAKIANSSVTVAKISATGTPSSTNFLRGDGSWGTVSAGGATGQNAQLFTSSGTFTIPSGVTSVKATLVGGGGGGGAGYQGTTGWAGGGGGGSGGAGITWITGLTPGNTLAITVGAGGGSNANGGNTTISSGTQSITTRAANGGGRGNIWSNFTYTQFGGTTSNLEFVYPSTGGDGASYNAPSGYETTTIGGGGSCGTGGISSTTGLFGGRAGRRQGGVAYGNAGESANGYGNGGTGGCGPNASSGSQGFVLIEW